MAHRCPGCRATGPGAWPNLVRGPTVKTVPLHGKKAAGRVALVDDVDYELVSRYRWHVREATYPGLRSNGPYAQTNVPISESPRRYKSLGMHTLLTGWLRVDHVDHDGLNNQRANLRPATPGQNNANRRPRIYGSSPFKGVYWYKAGHVWRARFRGDGKEYHLGQFATEEEAARAYDAVARATWGEYAYLNFPDAATSRAQ